MTAPFQGPHVHHGDIMSVKMSDGELRTDYFDADSLRRQVGPNGPKWLREMVDAAAAALAAEAAYDPAAAKAITTIATAASEIDILAAENSSLRDELDDLRNTDVGELAARCDELWAENQHLRTQLRRKS